VACRLKAGISESDRKSVARQRRGNHVSCIIVWMTIKTHSRDSVYITDRHHRNEILKSGRNEYASDRCIRKQEIEWLDKVSSIQSAKDS
jgi:hypothetical protein